MPDIPATRAELESQLKALEQEAAPSQQPSSATKELQQTMETLKELQTKLPAQQPWSPELVGGLSAGLLVFGVFLFVLIGKLIFHGKVKEPAGDSQWLLRILVVPLCVLTAVFLVIVGFSTEQSAPAVGLLGTIIGYLLGSGARGVAPPPGTGTGTGTGTDATENQEAGAEMALLMAAKNAAPEASIPAKISLAIARSTHVRPIRLLRPLSYHAISGEDKIASLAVEITKLVSMKISTEELAVLLNNAKDPTGDAICTLVEKHLA